MLSRDFDSTLAKLRPVIGEMADAFWLASLLDPGQEKDLHAVTRAMAAELLGEDYAAKQILLEPPPSDTASGEYPIGIVTYAGRKVRTFALRETDLPQHILILGRSGAGKTNVGNIVIWNLLRSGKPFTVLDWQRNYRHFLNRPLGKDVILLALGESESLSFNPLDPPPGLTLNQREAYLRDIVSVICTTYLPGHHLLSSRGVEYLLLEAINDLGTSPGKPVTFNAIGDLIVHRGFSSREKDWKASVLLVLFKLTTGPVGRIANTQGSICFNDIVDRQAILEMDGLGSESDRAFFTQALLLWLFYYRLSRGKPASSNHVTVVEEAHHLFLRRAGIDQSVHDLMLRQMRGLGEGLVLLDQCPSLLTTAALGNTGVTVCLNLKHGDDVEAAGKALTLPREQWEHIGRLPVGHGIVKLQDRWTRPFLVRFPHFPVSRPIKPPQDQRSNPQGDSSQRSPPRTDSNGNEAIQAIREDARKESKTERITMEERGLLEDIGEHPLSVVTERYQRLGWHPQTGTAVKGRLLEGGLVEQERVSVPEGSVTLLKLTDAGRELLASWGIQVKTLPKNASLEHEYWKQITAERYRALGYSVDEEVPIGGGKAVDLVATKGGARIAIEIETGKSDEDGNVKKCREAGFEKIQVVRTSGIIPQPG